MADEAQGESVASESAVETVPIPEPVAPEPTTESQSPETPTAQPVEPLLESVPEPTSTSESVPEPGPTSAPEPVPEPEPIPTLIQTPPPPQAMEGRGNLARELLVKARDIIQFRKRKKLEKIMSLFLKQSSITNDDVQKLVYVSDATATRYLQQLEKEGKVRRQGSPEHMSYSRI